MADLRSKTSRAETIIYLRLQSELANAAWDIAGNIEFRNIMAPRSELTDIPLEGFSDEKTLTSQLSTHDNNYNWSSRQTTSDPYHISPRVLRLGFSSIEEPSAQGITCGFGPSSDVKLPSYQGKSGVKDFQYFRIHYNFDSGALLITAMDKIMIGSAILNINESLLLMAGTKIECGGILTFIIEFPDLSDCAEEHEQNYQKYATAVGISGAQYMATPLDEDLAIGREHRSRGILGQGTFGEVHKAVNIKTGDAFAIKILSGGGESEMKEVNLMSDLCHDNIIKYERAFRLSNGKICIVMELAVNDLYMHQKARENGMGRSYLSLQCIQSIGRQALSALAYLHEKGVMHRDLKPQNMLVTKWDAATDIPTIKLADFVLAGIGAVRSTFCGTEDYIAPEVFKAQQEVTRIENQTGRLEPVLRDILLSYDNSVDIWALGKILHQLVQDVPFSISILRGKTVPINREPALRFIRRMMEEDPRRRLTAADSLMEPWMTTDDSSASLLVQKRNRSPTPSTSSSASGTGRPLQKAARK